MDLNTKKELSLVLETEKNDETGTVLKLSKLGQEKIKAMDNVQIHNLGEERNVGFINYQLDVRGKDNLEAVSRKLVLNKSGALNLSSRNFRKFRKPAAEIQEYKLSWNAQMEEMERVGYSKKELVCRTVEKTKLEDFEFFQHQRIPGPMPTKEKVIEFMESEPDSKEKN